MRVGLVAANPRVGKKSANLKKMEVYIEQADADLLIFGELFLTGYGKPNQLGAYAEKTDGKSIKKAKRLAKKYKKHLIFGCPVREGNKIYNSALFVHPDGKIDSYFKNYLPDFPQPTEKIVFTSGKGPKVFDTSLGKIGMCICYDAFFPELWKLISLKGAELIICVSASLAYWSGCFELVLPARALENTVFVAFVNLVGKQDNMIFWGESQVYGPWGNLMVKAPYFKERIDYAELDFGEIKAARADRPFLKDTKL
jgi:predicted amidohydrolase